MWSKTEEECTATYSNVKKNNKTLRPRIVLSSSNIAGFLGLLLTETRPREKIVLTCLIVNEDYRPGFSLYEQLNSRKNRKENRERSEKRVSLSQTTSCTPKSTMRNLQTNCTTDNNSASKSTHVLLHFAITTPFSYWRCKPVVSLAPGVYVRYMSQWIIAERHD
jgi:hypothetical protein